MKQKNIKLTTPKAKLTGFIALQNPSKFKDDPIATYSVSVQLTKDQAEPILEKIKTLQKDQLELERAKGTAKPLGEITCLAPMGKKDVDKEGNSTFEADSSGDYILRANLKAGFVQKDASGKKVIIPQKPTIFDSSANLFLSNKRICRGSLVRLAVEFSAYTIKEVCISCRLKAVQVIDLIEFEEVNADDVGFKVEEDGYIDEFDSEENEASQEENTKVIKTDIEDDDTDGDF